jgi:hypothetical protein
MSRLMKLPPYVVDQIAHDYDPDCDAERGRRVAQWGNIPLLVRMIQPLLTVPLVGS